MKKVLLLALIAIGCSSAPKKISDIEIGEICRTEYGASKWRNIKKYLMVRLIDRKAKTCYDHIVMKDEDNRTKTIKLDFKDCSATCKIDYAD